MIDQKQMENVEYFHCLGSMITDDPKCVHEIKFRIAMEKAAFHQQIGLKFKEETSRMCALLWKRLWTCCKTDYIMNEEKKYVYVYIYIYIYIYI